MMTAPSAGDAYVATLAVALLAFLLRALTWDGALAGLLIGLAVSAGFGLSGLAVLGTFFVVGTLATRIGWARKRERGTAEAGGGRRDAKRVLGKGGVAAAVALLHAFRAEFLGPSPDAVFTGAVAAALADTLGTEIGTLWTGRVLLLPRLRLVPAGTPGGVSLLGTAAAAAGALVVVIVAEASGLLVYSADPGFAAIQSAQQVVGLTIAGFAGAMSESLAVGCGLRAPGFVRNLLATGIGALCARGCYVIR